MGFLPATGPGLRVADIGCGTGRQTEVLARHLDGTITAVDLLPGMIEELRARMKRTGLSEKVTALVGSMDELPFGDEELDLIWPRGRSTTSVSRGGSPSGGGSSNPGA